MKSRLLLVLSVSVLAAAGFATPAVAEETTRYVALTGTDNPTCDKENPCRHVQHAADVAAAGETIRVEAGTYVEQVLVGKSLDIVGAGVDTTTIKGPDTKVLDDFLRTYVVELTGAITVDMTRLTVDGPSGPGGGLDCAPNPLSLDNGISVVHGATLNLALAAVRDIYDIDASGNENSGCQRGTAISVGRPGGSPTPTMGHAHIAGVQVTRYQKNGVAVRSAGSTLTLLGSRVANQPSNVIASNGVEVLDAARGDVRDNSVTGNQCNVPVACGPDPINNTEASGILGFGADAATLVANNDVRANDMGIYTDDATTIRDNRDSDNRTVGIYVDTDATHARISGNTTNHDGSYGIAIGPMFLVSEGGTGKPNPGGNFFTNDTAFGNQKFDLWQSADAGPNVNRNNHCGTAFPSKSYWDCDGGDGQGDGGHGGGEGADGGGGGHSPASKDD
ncbi:MAG TPA: right-handed parallel beta-helix repeat-containing protein [Candidatus Dormibacteraeota bacterium]